MRYLLAVLCALAIVVTQVLYGGAMRPVFALPGLALTALAGALGLVAVCWRNVPAPSIPCVSAVLALAGWLIWRELESADVWLASGYLRLTVGCLVIYLLFACIITNPFHRLAFIGVLLLAAIVQSGMAALQFARVENNLSLPWLSEQLRLWYSQRWSWRGHGTYLNGNHLVWFLNVSGVMALALTCWGRWGLTAKILCLYVALASFAGSVLTLSRGGMLGLSVALVTFLLLSALALVIGARDRRLVALLVMAAVVLSATTVGFWLFKSSFTVQQRFEEIVKDEYRPAVFQAVLRQAQLEPFWGTGAGTFLYYGRAYREMNSFADDTYAHNDWMQLAADFGLPAVLLLIAVVWTHARSGLRGLRSILLRRMATHSRPQSHAAAVLIGALACLAAFVVHSLFDFNMQMPANALLAAGCLGMLGNTGAVSQRVSDRWSSAFRRGTVILGGLCAFWLIHLVTACLGGEFFWLKAENALLTGRLEQAEMEAKAGLAANITHPRLHATLGQVYLAAALQTGDSRMKKGLVQRAEESFTNATRLSPLDARLYRALGQARWVNGKYSSAAALDTAIRLWPGLGAAYQLRAEILESRGEWRGARILYRLAAQMPWDPVAKRKEQELDKKILILERQNPPGAPVSR